MFGDKEIFKVLDKLYLMKGIFFYYKNTYPLAHNAVKSITVQTNTTQFELYKFYMVMLIIYSVSQAHEIIIIKVDENYFIG